jgi:hypothetical protein
MKIEYDKFGNTIYYETEDGYWFKNIFDDNNVHIYYENYYGIVIDYRRTKLSS